MKQLKLFKSQTAVATLIQFITLSFLGLANGANSVVTTCRHDGGNCIGNLIVSIIFFMLTALWFAIVWILGYAAQERRSRRLALILIAAEGLIMIIAYHNAKHHTDAIGLITSLIDLLLALWIVSLAFQLVRAGSRGHGGRGKHPVTAPQGSRPRQRRRPTSER